MIDLRVRYVTRGLPRDALRTDINTTVASSEAPLAKR